MNIEVRFEHKGVQVFSCSSGPLSVAQQIFIISEAIMLNNVLAEGKVCISQIHWHSSAFSFLKKLAHLADLLDDERLYLRDCWLTEKWSKRCAATLVELMLAGAPERVLYSK